MYWLGLARDVKGLISRLAGASFHLNPALRYALKNITTAHYILYLDSQSE